jgi:hypothetical protein
MTASVLVAVAYFESAGMLSCSAQLRTNPVALDYYEKLCNGSYYSILENQKCVTSCIEVMLG